MGAGLSHYLAPKDDFELAKHITPLWNMAMLVPVVARGALYFALFAVEELKICISKLNLIDTDP